MALIAPHVIPEEGLLNFRRYYFVRKRGKDVMFQIFSCCFLEGNPKTILETLEDNGVNMGRKSPFNHQEIDNLSDKPPQSLDITTLNKICQELWLKGLNDPGDRLKELMKRIIDERKEVSHAESNIPKSELDIKLQDFGNILEEALDEAAVLYPCHGTYYNQLKTNIRDDIPKIQKKIREKYDPSNLEDIKRLQEEIEEFGDQLRDYIREKSRAQLIRLYPNPCKILPFDWLCQYGTVDPGFIMVSLQMDTAGEFHGSQNSHKPITLDHNEILDKKDPNGNDPKVIILCGDAGSGKTTLLCWLMEKWHKEETHDIPSLSTYEILLHMEFRKHDHDNFDDYLKDLLQHVVTEIGYQQVKSSVLCSNCLILCDGFDERNDRSLKLFKEMLELKCNTMKIIVTTRPLNIEELTRTVNKAKRHMMNLTVLGLQEENVKHLIERLSNHLIQDHIERNELINGITCTFQSAAPEMKQIMKNPLQLNLFSLLYIECPDLRKTIPTVTKLFIEFGKLKSKRLMETLEIEEEAVLEFEKLYRQWSLKYYLQRKFELGQTYINILREKCNELNLCFDSVMSTYFNIKHSRKGPELVKIYCYRHRIEQEFAAAGAICDEIVKFHEEKKSENLIVHILKYMGHDTEVFDENELLLEIMKYLASILYNTEKNISYLVIDDILAHWGYLITDEGFGFIDELLMYIADTENDDKVVDSVARMMESIQYELIISRNECLACVPSLLSKIKRRLTVNLILKDNFDDITHLIPALEAFAQNNTELELHLSDEVISDAYIEIAKNCVYFEGRLSCKGIDIIPKCMKSLFLSMNLEDLNSLSSRLQVLKQLECFNLRLHDDGFFSPPAVDVLHPIPLSGVQIWSLTFSTNYDAGKNHNVQRTVKMLNSIWPRKLEDSTYTILLLSNTPGYKGDEVEMMLNSLNIQHLNSLTFFGVADDAKDREEELKSLAKTRGFENIRLSR